MLVQLGSRKEPASPQTGVTVDVVAFVLLQVVDKAASVQLTKPLLQGAKVATGSDTCPTSPSAHAVEQRRSSTSGVPEQALLPSNAGRMGIPFQHLSCLSSFVATAVAVRPCTVTKVGSVMTLPC